MLIGKKCSEKNQTGERARNCRIGKEVSTEMTFKPRPKGQLSKNFTLKPTVPVKK